MKTQQQAEREEQQRIKNLVLNYDLRENEDPDGDTLLTPLNPNRNIHTSIHSGHDKPSSYYTSRSDKSGKERGGQRVRRLQLSDVDWYGNSKDQKVEQNDSNYKGSLAGTTSERESAPDRVDGSSMSKRHNSPTDSRSRRPNRRGRGKR